MKGSRTLLPIIRMLLLAGTIAGGVLAIIASNGDPCLDIGASCESNGECCANNCEEGRCCRGDGAELGMDESQSVCCSGRRRTGIYGPYCCGTEGRVVVREEVCCEGLGRDVVTGRCSECPSPCYWAVAPSTWGPGRTCVCPDSPGYDPEYEPPPITPCTECDDPAADDCWFVRVAHEGYFGSELVLGQGCRVYGPFYAPDEGSAQDCARAFATAEGISHDWAWEIETYDEPVAVGNLCLR